MFITHHFQKSHTFSYRQSLRVEIMDDHPFQCVATPSLWAVHYVALGTRQTQWIMTALRPPPMGAQWPGGDGGGVIPDTVVTHPYLLWPLTIISCIHLIITSCFHLCHHSCPTSSIRDQQWPKKPYENALEKTHKKGEKMVTAIALRTEKRNKD